MKTDIKKELLPVLEAIRILSPHQLQFAGQTVDAGAPAGPGYGQPVQNPLLTHLMNQLYHHAYAHRFTGRLYAQSGATEIPGFIRRLSGANQSRERWDPAWQVIQQSPDGSIFAQKGTLMGHFRPGQYASQSYQLTPGSRIQIFMPKESTEAQPHFYYAFSETPIDYLDEDNIFRLYWNCGAEGVPPLLKWLTATLNRYQAPFRFKAATRQEMYSRRDPVVLYVNKRFTFITSQLLATVPEPVGRHLRPDVPLFSKPVGRGIGFAEDPGRNESFGMNRCRIVAEGILNAYQDGQQDSAARWQAVEQQFEAYGLDVQKPWLNEHSADIYSFQIAA